jgi:hypothetical protein
MIGHLRLEPMIAFVVGAGRLQQRHLVLTDQPSSLFQIVARPKWLKIQNVCGSHPVVLFGKIPTC